MVIVNADRKAVYILHELMDLSLKFRLHMGHWSQGWIQDIPNRGSPGATLALDNPLSAKHTILGGGGMHPQKIF